ADGRSIRCWALDATEPNCFSGKQAAFRPTDARDSPTEASTPRGAPHHLKYSESDDIDSVGELMRIAPMQRPPTKASSPDIPHNAADCATVRRSTPPQP